MDKKARSKPMRNILDRILFTKEDVEIVVFGDKVILDEPIENWPSCDFLISFYSDGFPLEKALAYVRLWNPICLNQLPMQQLLLDRRLVLSVLDAIGVPTPRRLVTWHKDFPKLTPEVTKVINKLGIHSAKYSDTHVSASVIDHDTIQVEDCTLAKPFVEKPVSGEDHNIFIYFSKEQGGGVRRLFRKVSNKSSEYLPDASTIRCDGIQSYIYEEFMDVDNAEDVKVYTLGPHQAYAETRKSPVVDGIVRRNEQGKEIRYLTPLSDEEKVMAKKVCEVFGQTICGFDLLRAKGKSWVIDVNGWSFVKGSDEYYDKCAQTIYDIFMAKVKQGGIFSMVKRQMSVSVENQWKTKGYFSVLRHADRTPKQKIKFTFKCETLLKLVLGSEEEIVLKKYEQIVPVMESLRVAISEGIDDPIQLGQIVQILEEKASVMGTKVQLRPSFDKSDTTIKKIQIIVKWGGLLTHGGHFHSNDLGITLRKDLNIVHKKLLDNVKVYCSSEMRVIATADTMCKALLAVTDLPADFLIIRKEMLDDSNAAKEQMDQVKLRLQAILNPDDPATPPVEFVMPQGMADLAVPVYNQIRLLKNMRNVMHTNLLVPYSREWCTPDSPFLFRERWEKLFRDICDVPRAQFEPSKISELYDSLKYDLLHNRDFLEYAFASGTEENFVRDLYIKSKEIFDVVGPHEYGIEAAEKVLIGYRNTSYLMKQLVTDIEHACMSANPCTRLYFTKESKVYCLLNALLLSGLKVKIVPTDIPELDCNHF